MSEERFTNDEMINLARKGVNKVDLLGIRGATLVSCDEVIAMAMLLALSGVLPAPGAPAVPTVAVRITEAGPRPANPPVQIEGKAST